MFWDTGIMESRNILLPSLSYSRPGRSERPLRAGRVRGLGKVDDALVNFDNARARAALKVLGNLGARTQVIFFTYPQHMVNLAKEAVDARMLHIQELITT